MHLGRTKSPENVSRGLKCCLIPVSPFDLAEPLDATGGTLRFRGTPVENTAPAHVNRATAWMADDTADTHITMG